MQIVYRVPTASHILFIKLAPISVAAGPGNRGACGTRRIRVRWAHAVTTEMGNAQNVAETDISAAKRPEWQQNGAFLAFPGGSDTKGPVPIHMNTRVPQHP